MAAPARTDLAPRPARPPAPGPPSAGPRAPARPPGGRRLLTGAQTGAKAVPALLLPPLLPFPLLQCSRQTFGGVRPRLPAPSKDHLFLAQGRVFSVTRFCDSHQSRNILGAKPLCKAASRSSPRAGCAGSSSTSPDPGCPEPPAMATAAAGEAAAGCTWLVSPRSAALVAAEVNSGFI